MFMIINMLKSKKLFMFILIIISVAGLNAKWLYLDAGIGCDFTRINFTKLWEGDGVVVGDLIGSNYDYFTGPNFNYKLGIRFNDMFILTFGRQSVKNINEHFYSQIVSTHGIEANYMLHLKSFEFAGVGLVFYPHQSFQLSSTLYFVKPNCFQEWTERNMTVGYIGDWLSGGGYDVSIAYDIPIRKMGILIGCRYFYAQTNTNFLILSGIDPIQEISSFGLFIKIRY